MQEHFLFRQLSCKSELTWQILQNHKAQRNEKRAVNFKFKLNFVLNIKRLCDESGIEIDTG